MRKIAGKMKQGLSRTSTAVIILGGVCFIGFAQEQTTPSNQEQTTPPNQEQTTPSNQELKLAFVDTVAILQGTAEGKQEISQVENYIAQERKKLESETTEIQELRQQLISQGGSLNTETRQEMQRQIEDKERELQRLQEDIEREINRRRTEMFNRMSEKIQSVIVSYAEENNLSVVFIRDPALPYLSPALDVTEAIIKAYDAANPVQTSTTPPSPPPQQ